MTFARLKEASKGAMGCHPSSITRPCAMGVDCRPGSYDVAIGEAWRVPGRDHITLKLAFYGKVQDEEDVEFLAEQYPVSCGMIDSRPDGTLAKRAVTKLNKMRKDFWRAQYNSNPSNVEFTKNEKERLVTLERTMTMDNVLYGFQSGQGIAIPQNFRDIHRHPGDDHGEFVAELLAPTRVSVVWHGIEGFRWTENNADHSFHAINYLMMAATIGKLHLPRGPAMMASQGAVQGTLGDALADEPYDETMPALPEGYDGDGNPSPISWEM